MRNQLETSTKLEKKKKTASKSTSALEGIKAIKEKKEI